MNYLIDFALYFVAAISFALYFSQERTSSASGSSKTKTSNPNPRPRHD